MISYRKLAMRVLGHPLRVPSPRPASHRVTALALTAAMVAGMAAPAYADTYYIGDGDITITKDETGTQVKQGNNTKTDTDGNIIIKGGKNPEGTTASGGSSSTGITSAPSPAQPKLTAPPSEDSDSENEDRVYLGDTKGSTSSTGSGEENENQPDDTTGGEENETDPTKKDQTGGKNTGAGSSDPESKGSESGTSGSAGGTPTTGSETPAEGTEGTESTESSLSTPKSQFTYTGASLKVADANDDEETRNESTTALERAAENFRSTAENVTNYVIRIINKAKGNDNTLNVTLDNVNIKAKNNAALSVEGAGNTTITLKGDNTLTSDGQHAGLEHNEKDYYGREDTGKLTITSGNENGRNTGSLTATGSGASAGIGSVWNTGKVSNSGAGTIEITGGDITAIDASDGAGIGSGTWATGETNITISGTAKINARTDQGGAGIGSGNESTGTTTVTIKGGTIEKAKGGDGIRSDGKFAISESLSGNANPYTIETAQGGDGNASGGSGIFGKTMEILFGIINQATGGNSTGTGENDTGGAGISASKSLAISGWIQHATGGSAESGKAGNGIRSGKSFIISGGRIEYATGGSGIHGGESLVISGGYIDDATGGNGGAGIGSGDNGPSSVTISGGTITATGTSEAPAIGGGSVSISNTDAALDITATAPNADNAIQSKDGKKLDEVIQLAENGKKGLVKLVKSGTTSISRLFHNGVYAASQPSHSGSVKAEMSEAEKAKYGDISSVHNWTVSGRQEPTCGKDGYIDYICMVDHCGTTFRHTLPAAGQHTWNEGVVTKKPTCTELGVRTFTCTVCHNTRTEAIEAPGHEYGEWVIDRDATCIEEGSKHRDCIRGDATQTESIPATGQHQWKVLSTTAATCGQDGTVTYQCEVCGDTKTETLNATGQHSYGAGVVTKAATCAEPGIMTYTCVVCGDSYTESIPVDKTAHKWDAGVVTKEATCTADGVRTFTCSACGDTRTEAIEALGHEYGEWVIDRDATCVEQGSKHRDCIRGDDTQTEAIPVSKTHTFGEWVITKEPTCTEKGEKQRSCTVSGCVVTETQELPALGHQWSSWTPVEGDSSREYRICAVCDAVEYRDVSHSSDNSTISTGLRVLDPAQADILQNVQLVRLNQISDVLYIDVTHETASLQGVLSDLTGLRSERIETVVFSTERCTSTLSLSDVAALGAGDTPFTLRHSGSTASFIVGGADHSALLR